MLKQFLRYFGKVSDQDEDAVTNDALATRGPNATWEWQIFHACAPAHIKIFDFLCDNPDDADLDPQFERLLGNMLGQAVHWHQAAMLRHLINRDPDHPEQTKVVYFATLTTAPFPRKDFWSCIRHY